VQRLASSPCREPTTVLHRARFDVGLAKHLGLCDPATVQIGSRRSGYQVARSHSHVRQWHLHVDEAGFLNRGAELGLSKASYAHACQ
jgi:hypothetical protein